MKLLTTCYETVRFHQGRGDGRHTGAVLKKFVTLMLFAMSLVSDDLEVIASMLEIMVEAFMAALETAARARPETMEVKRILTRWMIEEMKIGGKRKKVF